MIWGVGGRYKGEVLGMVQGGRGAGVREVGREDCIRHRQLSFPRSDMNSLVLRESCVAV